MPRQYRIRWRDDDHKQLEKAVRNFNAKIDRIAKKNPEIKNALPDRVQVRELKKLIETRRDLNKEINSLLRFNKKRGFDINKDIVTIGKYNTKVTKWQIKEINLRTKIVNQKRKARLEKFNDMEMKLQGIPLGYTKAQIGMGSQESYQFKEIKGISDWMGISDIKKKFKALRKESQADYHLNMDSMFQNNVINGLLAAFPESEIKDIVDKIRSLSPEEFYKKYKSDYGASDYNISPKNDPLFDMDENREQFIEGLKGIWLSD